MRKSIPFSKKIIRILVSAVAGFCVLLGSIVCVASGIGLYRNLTTFAKQNTLQAISDMDLYVQTAVSASRTVTDNENIVKALRTPTATAEIDNAMTQFHLTTFSVYSAQLYDLHGNAYKTAGTEDLPSLNNLKSDSFFSDFIESEKQEIYWLRKDCLPGIYNNNRYDKSAGMYTFVTKVTDGVETVGYFLMDFHPSRMLNTFFDNRGATGYERSAAYLVTGGTVLTSSSGTDANPHDFLPKKPSSITQKGNLLYISEPLSAPDASLVVALPLTSFFTDLTILIVITFACCAVCTVGSYFLLRFTMKRTLKPLIDLTNELKKTKRVDP